MPSPRRLRLIFLLTLTAVISILYLTSSSRAAASSTHDFYARTRSRLDANRTPKGSLLDKIKPERPRRSGNDEDDKVAEEMSRRLLDAEVAAKELANRKAPTKESLQMVVGAKDGGGGEVDRPKPKPKAKDRNVAGRKKYPIAKEEEEVVEQADNEEVAAAEMNSILKMSPIIIFSKTYCGFSRKAKTILLEKYAIVPAPYVVELDTHPLGPELQAHLATMTGRRTVPNVLVRGKSIGGGDDVAALDGKGELASRVMVLGGKGVSVSLREGEGEGKS